MSSCSCLCLSHPHFYHQSDETNLTARHRSCEPLRCTSCFLSYIENVEKMCQNRASSSLAVNLGSSHSRQPPALNRLHRRCPLPRELRSCQEIFASIASVVEIVVSCMLLDCSLSFLKPLTVSQKSNLWSVFLNIWVSHPPTFPSTKEEPENQNRMK